MYCVFGDPFTMLNDKEIDKPFENEKFWADIGEWWAESDATAALQKGLLSKQTIFQPPADHKDIIPNAQNKPRTD
jgi:hypothetical protein